MGDSDIWAGMDTGSSTDQDYSAAMESDGDLSSSQHSESKGETDLEIPMHITPTVLVDDGMDDGMAAFLESMQSHENLFPDSSRFLKAPYSTRQWIQTQLLRVTGANSVAYARSWLNMLGDEMPIERYANCFGIMAEDFGIVYDMAMLGSPDTPVSKSVKLPISIFLRAFDVFMVCKAVARGLHEMPTPGEEMDDDNMVVYPWTPNASAWGAFLPLFSEGELFEAAVDLILTDFMHRGLISPFNFVFGEKITDIKLRLTQLLSDDGAPPLKQRILQPVDMFSLRVAEHLRPEVASRIAGSAAGFVLQPVIQAVVVEYTMDIATDIDYYVCSALNGSAAVSGGQSFIQVLHDQMLKSVFVETDVKVRPNAHPHGAYPEECGLTSDFLGTLCLPVPERIARLPAIDQHRNTVAELKSVFRGGMPLERSVAMLEELRKMETDRQRKWCREMRLLAKGGHNLIQRYPPTVYTVPAVRMLIKQLDPAQRTWTAWQSTVITKLEFLAKKRMFGMQPVDLETLKIAPMSPSSDDSME